jgi:lipopolysaccharide/colanic/teichoic acid biosynthesis glycosyltransferase
MLTESAGAAQDMLVGDLTLAPSAAVARRARPASRRHRVTDPALVHAAKRANSPLKRIFDFTAAAGGLVFLAPLLAPVALLVKLQDGGPVFFGHERAGRYSKAFKCWKFRTMRPDSAALLQAYLAENPAALEEWQRTQKLENDPRVTPIGRFLRATSLDELPQLFNVLLGEMSLVGPRPVPKAELNDRYGKERRYYLLMRPGITGLWQVSGRSNTTYERRIAFDREYAIKWSFKRDIEIILRTLPAVLKAEGAR